MADKRNLFLYEALELRSEYDARINTFKDMLPETRSNSDARTICRTEPATLLPFFEVKIVCAARPSARPKIKWDADFHRHTQIKSE